MTLTMEQKEDLLFQYDQLIWKVVHHFKRRFSHLSSNTQDLHQEAIVAFLTYVEKHGAPDGMFIFPFRDILNALCRYTLTEQVVSSPKRTTDYTRRISSSPSAADYDVLDLEASARKMNTDDMVNKVYFDQFVQAQSLMDQQIIRMKLDGSRNRDVARALGLPDCNITRRLSRMKKAYYAS